MGRNFKKHISPLFLATVFALTGGIFAFAQSGEPLSVKEQAEVFEDAWKLVNEKYYDPNLNGVNWQSVREKYKPLVENFCFGIGPLRTFVSFSRARQSFPFNSLNKIPERL